MGWVSVTQQALIINSPRKRFWLRMVEEVLSTKWWSYDCLLLHNFSAYADILLLRRMGPCSLFLVPGSFVNIRVFENWWWMIEWLIDWLIDELELTVFESDRGPWTFLLPDSFILHTPLIDRSIQIHHWNVCVRCLGSWKMEERIKCNVKISKPSLLQRGPTKNLLQSLQWLDRVQS